MARSRRSDDVDAPAPARSDAYVGLLLISLLAQVAGALFFYLDWSQYEGTPKLPPAAAAPAPAGGPGGGAGGNPAQGGNPAGGNPAAGGGPAGVPK